MHLTPAQINSSSIAYYCVLTYITRLTLFASIQDVTSDRPVSFLLLVGAAAACGAPTAAAVG
jgi:hypothetical protein